MKVISTSIVYINLEDRRSIIREHIKIMAFLENRESTTGSRAVVPLRYRYLKSSVGIMYTKRTYHRRVSLTLTRLHGVVCIYEVLLLD